jgi:hypothetical protein
MTFRHLWQTWASLYHQRPRTHALSPPSRRALSYPRLRLKEMADRDKIRGEGNHHRGCGSMQYVDCCPWAMFTQKPISITGERSVPLLLGLAYIVIVRFSQSCVAIQEPTSNKGKGSMYTTCIVRSHENTYNQRSAVFLGTFNITRSSTRKVLTAVRMKAEIRGNKRWSERHMNSSVVRV